jgi:hypothetical protein
MYQNPQCLYNQQRATLLSLISALSLQVSFNNSTIEFLSASAGLNTEQVKSLVEGWSNDGVIEFRNMPGGFSLCVNHSHWMYKQICGER